MSEFVSKNAIFCCILDPHRLYTGKIFEIVPASAVKFQKVHGANRGPFFMGALLFSSSHDSCVWARKGRGLWAPQAFPGKPLRLNERHIWLSSFEATQRLVVITTYPEKLKKSLIYSMKFARTRVFEIRRQPNRSQTLVIPPFPGVTKIRRSSLTSL